MVDPLFLLEGLVTAVESELWNSWHLTLRVRRGEMRSYYGEGGLSVKYWRFVEEEPESVDIYM